MDFEHIQTRLPSLNEVNEQLQACINESTHTVVQRLLHQIAANENLSYDYLNEKYGNVSESISVNGSTKKPRVPISSGTRCLAKISNNGRCSRSRKGKGMYCGGHAVKRPHGEFDASGADAGVDAGAGEELEGSEGSLEG